MSIILSIKLLLLYTYIHIDNIQILMQELDRSIYDICHRVISHSPVSPEQQRAIDLFLKLNQNVGLIFRAIPRVPDLLVCFKMMTQEQRRTGQYFKSPLNQFHQSVLILEMLRALKDFPQYPLKEHRNIYLSLVGELLAKYTMLTEDSVRVNQYFRNLFESEHADELKIRDILKILTVCLQQIIILRKSYTGLSQRRKNIISFTKNYGPCFIPIVTSLFSTITKEFYNFNDKWQIVKNVLNLIHSFLEVMNHVEGEAEEKTIGALKCIVRQWQAEYFMVWVEHICFFLRKIFEKMTTNQLIQAQQIQQINQVALRSITLFSYINQLKFSYSKESCIEQIRKLIIHNFLLNYFDLFSKMERICQKLYYLCDGFHAAVINLLLSENYLIEQIIKSAQMNLEEILMTKSIRNLLNYCNFCLNNSGFNFSNFNQCPLGLTIQLMAHLKTIAYQITQQKIQRQLQEFQLEERKELMKYDTDLKNIRNELKSIYHQFCEYFIFKKLFEPMKKKEQEQNALFQEGKDWSQFLTNVLNEYFMQLVPYLPQYLTQQDIYSEHQFQIPEIIPENSDRLKTLHEKKMNFLKLPGFRIVYQLLYEILKQIKEHDFLADQFLFGYSSDVNRGLFQICQKNTFVKLIPIISLLRAIIFKSLDSEKKAYIYYELYQLAGKMEIEKFLHPNKFKAKICKLYILKTFFEECMPESFYELGEDASCTNAYLKNNMIIQIEDLIKESTQIIAQCLATRDESEQDEVEIVSYGFQILQYIIKRLSQRLFYLQNESSRFDLFVVLKSFEIRLQAILEAVINFQLKSPASFQKQFQTCGMIAEIFGLSTVFQLTEVVFSETIDMFDHRRTRHENIDLFLAAATGLLKSLTKTQFFQVAVEKFLYNDDIVNGIMNNDQIIQHILPFLSALLTQKLCPSETKNNSIVVRFIDLFQPKLKQWLQFGLTMPDLQHMSIQIYTKFASIDPTQELIPLSQNYDFAKEEKLLEAYFESIDRLNNLDEMLKYATLRVEWLNHYIEAKLDRNEYFQISLEELAPNIRYEKQKKIMRLASNLGIAMKKDKKQILAILQKQFNLVDSVLYVQLEGKNKERRLNQEAKQEQ